MKLALLTAALNGDNSGDAIIESAVRRLLATEDLLRLPLTQPLGEDEVDRINACDSLVICGTNLYQHVFACNLTKEVVDRIKVPIIPFGIGSSAAMGSIPKMLPGDVETVRAIHRKCVVSGVRDEASLRFLHSIGVKNTVLTGCPVLFHGLSRPDFRPSGEGYTLTPRARLLHIEETWNSRQLESLEFLCRRYRPRLVLQSPYDVPVAERLAQKYGVEILLDENWQAEQYVVAAKSQSVNIGFRLHFAMLSLSYGKPCHIVAHDSRVSEFCKLVGIPVHDIRSFSDNALALRVDAGAFAADQVRRRWDELSQQMCSFMASNGLATRLTPGTAAARPAPRRPSAPPVPKRPAAPPKPRILMLVDKRNWAFDISARQLAARLKDDFRFEIRYVRDNPKLDPGRYDLLYLFFWGESYYRQFGFEASRIIKEISSHRWEDSPAYGPCSPAEFVEKYLADCGTVICTSKRLHDMVDGLHPRTYHTPNGYAPASFRLARRRSGPLSIGWAGNAEDPVKGLNDVLIPACQGRFQLVTAPGGRAHAAMNRFYNGLDVLAVASRHEGEPLTLIEAMAAGCFPVCTDVGIVPELVRHGENGLIVAERTPEAFAEAFAWCEANLDRVRSAGEANARLMHRERSWEVCAPYFKRAFLAAYRSVSQPRFRNDDVSFDTSLESFAAFCRVFHRHGLTQLHGVTLRGCTNTLYRYGDTPAEYPGCDTLSRLDNDQIRSLSQQKLFEERADLVDYLNGIPDAVALHGLYHTDYSRMSYAEQKEELTQGLNLLERLFPRKKVCYFIAPFNRTNEFTRSACRELGLDLLAADGVHLEAALDDLVLEQNTWYRYHHHRFYPESTFDYYQLNLEKLDRALGNNVLRQPVDDYRVTADQRSWRTRLARVFSGG